MLNNSQLPRVVYLDNFVWSKLIKSHAGLMPGSEGHVYRAALPVLQNMVKCGSVVFPVSFAHLAEIANYKNQQVRIGAITLMSTLSQGLCLPWMVMGQTPKRSITDVLGLFPSGANLLFLREFISGQHPAQALYGVLQDSSILSDMVETTILELNEALRTRQVPANEAEAESEVGEGSNANVDLAWLNEVFRLRLADPNRKVGHGDTIDLLSLIYASMTDAAVLDKGHSAMVRSSKLRKFWVGHRIEELIEHLREP